MIKDELLDYVASARLNCHNRGEGSLFPTLRRDPRGRLNTGANTIIMGACGVRSNSAAAASPIRCPGSTAGGISSVRASRTRGCRQLAPATSPAARQGKHDKYIHQHISELRAAIELIADPTRSVLRARHDDGC
jgi:hypothetical protein